MTLEQLQALALERSPFEEGPAGEFFFATPALTQRLDLLHHLIQLSDLLIVVSGPSGAGKTSFLGKVLEGAGNHWRPCPITAVGTLGVRALLERIMGGLDVPDRGTLDDEPESRLRRLAAHLEKLAAQGDLATVVVDDAGLLEDDALELVTQLAMRSSSLRARIVLAGDGALVERVLAIAARDGAKDLVHLVELPNLTEEQTGDYLHTRLGVAGMSGDSPFSPEAVTRIRRESNGIPRAINVLAEQELASLATRVTDEARRSRLAGLLMHWWKGLAVVAVAAVILAVAILVLPSQAPDNGPSAPPPRIIDLATTQGSVEGAKQDGPTFVIHGDPIPQSEPIRAEVASVAPGTQDAAERATSSAKSASDAPPPAAASKPSASSTPSDAALTSGKAPSDEAAKPRLLDAAAPPKPPSPGAGTPRANAPQSAPAPVKSSPPPSSTSRGTPKRAGVGRSIRTAAWIRAQPLGNYTIQLMGTFNRAAMRRYVVASDIGDRGAWFRSRHKGRPWFVVVYGSYPNRGAAVATAGRLPPRIAPGEPWVRKFADVVQVIE